MNETEMTLPEEVDIDTAMPDARLYPEQVPQQAASPVSFPDNETIPPPKSATHNEFSSWLVVLELRSDPTTGLTDPPSLTRQFRVSNMLEERYKDLPTAHIRPSHISFKKIERFVSRQFGFPLDFTCCELGYISAAPLPGLRDAYFTITSEATLRNALSVLFNSTRTSSNVPLLKLHLWNPIPTSSSLPAGRRAAAIFKERTSISAESRTKQQADLSQAPASASTPSSTLMLMLLKDKIPQPPGIQLPIFQDSNSPSHLTSKSPSHRTRKSPEAESTNSPSNLTSKLPSHRTRMLPEAESTNLPSHLASKSPNHHTQKPPEARSEKSRRTELPGSQSQPVELSEPGKVINDVHPNVLSEANISSHAVQGKAINEIQPGVPFNVSQLLKTVDDINAEVPDMAAFDNDEEYQKALEAHLEYMRDKDKDNLANVMDSHAITHLNPSIWKQVCFFFQHDETLAAPEYVVSIKGFDRKLLPVQAHGVWYALQAIHADVGGLYLAHVMGIGKTTMAFAIHHAQHVVNQMWAHVRQNPGSHVNPESDEFNNDQTSCPTGQSMLSDFGFFCPCYKSSPTHFLKERLGVSTAIVPLGLLDTWTKEHQMCFGHRSNQVIARAHASAVKAGHPRSISDSDWARMRGREEKQWDPNGLIGEKTPIDSKWHPRLENGTCFLISTSDSFSKHFIKNENNLKRKSFNYMFQGPDYTKKGTKVTPKPYQKTASTPGSPSCIVSLLCKDEVHMRQTQALAALEQLAQSQGVQLARFPKSQWGSKLYHEIAFILLSGTPLTTGPGDLTKFVSLMKRTQWKNHHILKHWMHNELASLSARWTKHLNLGLKNRDPLEADNIVQSITPLVETLMLRFTLETKFMSHDVVQVPKNYYREISCPHPGKWAGVANDVAAAEVRAHEVKEETRAKEYRKRNHGSMAGYVPLSKTNLNTYYRSRVIASFPALAELKDEYGNLLRLTADEWDDHIHGRDGCELWVPGTDSDPYFRNLKIICQSSGKLITYKMLLHKLSAKNGVLDAEGKETRHIVCSYFFVVVHILNLWFTKILKKDEQEIICIHPFSGGSAKRTAALDRFHIDINSEVPPEEQRTARFILATSSAIATGLTLAEAISVAFWEPDFNAHTMAQGYARHCRQGNKNKVVFSWLLTAEDNITETRILESNKMRAKIQESTVRTVKEAQQAISKAVGGGDSNLGI